MNKFIHGGEMDNRLLCKFIKCKATAKYVDYLNRPLCVKHKKRMDKIHGKNWGKFASHKIKVSEK